jgi:hypothetical protein
MQKFWMLSLVVRKNKTPGVKRLRFSALYFITGLRPQSPCHVAWPPSARGSQTLQPSYLSHVIAAATSADEYWHPHHSDCRKTLIDGHTISRTLPTCYAGLGSLTLSAPVAGDFVRLILVYLNTAGPSGRAVYAIGLRPLACCDRGFESHRAHGCLTVVCVVR